MPSRSTGRARIACVALVLAALRCAASVGDTSIVSLSSTGDQGDGASNSPSVSADGDVVTFLSSATNLIPGGSNGFRQTYARFRSAGPTAMVSLSNSGDQANDDSYDPVVSADGRFVAFTSRASNLVSGDTNGTWDVFVRDLLANTTEHVSIGSGGQQGNAFSFDPSLSADGRFVSFVSVASNLVPGDTNGVKDIFVRDRLLGTTVRVSVASDGSEANGQTTVGRISSDGTRVATMSYASNLVPGDTNGVADIFVRDLTAGTTVLVSCSSTGGPANGASQMPAIGSGRYVAFASDASNIVSGDDNGTTDVFVRDTLLGSTERVSVGLNSPSLLPAMTPDGRYVGFSTSQAGVTQAMVRDRLAGATQCASVSPGGAPGNGMSGSPVFSSDASIAVFQSDATNLVSGDANGATDVFARQMSDRATVFGTVQFGIPGPTPSSVDFRMQWGGWDEPFAVVTAPLSPTGAYSLDVPLGELVVATKPSHWLRRAVSVSSTVGGMTGVDFDLINGDAVEDNRVDLLDLSSVLSEFGSAGPDADLDGSGLVDLLDLATVLAGFGLTGDP